MYICRDCGCAFDTPVEICDDPSPAGVSLSAGCYVYQECPECGSDDFTEAYECERCGSYHADDSYLCPDCKEEFGIALREVKGRFKLDQSTFEEEVAAYFGW